MRQFLEHRRRFPFIYFSQFHITRSFLYPLETSKTSSFLFSGGIERLQWQVLYVLRILFQVKMLTKELHILRTANNETEETLESSKKVSQDLQKVIKDRDYEIEDINNMNSLKVKELEGAIAKLKKSIKEKDEECSRK